MILILIVHRGANIINSSRKAFSLSLSCERNVILFLHKGAPGYVLNQTLVVIAAVDCCKLFLDPLRKNESMTLKDKFSKRNSVG